MGGVVQRLEKKELTMSSSMSKLEYLKKYMSPASSSSKKDEKKSKKKKPVLKGKGGIKIIDEEIDIRKIAAGYENEEDVMDVQEEAPSIAGVVDERSEELRTKQDFVESKKWRQLGADSISQTSQDSPVASVANSSTKMKPSKSIQKRHDSDSDVSPPRKRHDSDSDASPPRRRTQDLDASPPRKRNDSDSDASPPRRRHDSDANPPRKRDNSDSDASPPRRRKKLPSPTRIKADPDGDLSPERTKVENKRAITLDGKKAGLQTGAALQKEMEELRKKQHKEFSRVDKALTGQNAETAIRGSKLRQIAEKKEQEKEKQEKLATLQAAYSKWNKGLKQGQDQAKKLAEDLD